MSSAMFNRHIERLRSAVTTGANVSICDFIKTNTFIRGKPFSFAGHEYQEKILNDQSQNIVILKSAQIGISEMSARLALARAVLINGFSTIYTLPAASAAANFMQTRIDPVIDSSPYLSEMVNNDVDNSTVKRFGKDSYLYLKGAQVDRQAISVPADMLINDEVDNSDQGVLTLYQSRIIASPYKLTVKLSTPTVPNYGIDLAYKESRRHLNMCKCDHCNHWFYPDYYEHVRIPGFLNPLNTIVRSHFANADFRWQDAYLACPRCGKAANLFPEHREWVIENPNDAFPTAGYRISPFDCPAFIKVSELVKSSVDYERPQDFNNQRLGIPMEDKESSLLREELDRCMVSQSPGGSFNRVMGLDMGMTCWCTIADVLPDDTLVIIHTEGIPLSRVIDRRRELKQQYRVRMTVVDHGPYTETVYRMQNEDANLFAGIYSSAKGADLFKAKLQEEDKEKGRIESKTVHIARNKGFDLRMSMVRCGQILKVYDMNDEVWKTHLTDQKRTRVFQEDELQFVWQKTSGEDHLDHSLLYTIIAAKLIGVTAGCNYQLPYLATFTQKR